MKDKVVKKEVVNAGKLKAATVVKQISERLNINFSYYDNKCLYFIFSITPIASGADDFDTNPQYCHYDEVYNDYLYQQTWVDFIVGLFEKNKFSKKIISKLYKKGTKKDVGDYV